MEKELDSQMEKIMNAKGVVGTLCVNDDGLCLQARGSLNKDSAGVFSELFRLASKLEPNSSSKPVVSLESESSDIRICSDGKFTLAVNTNRSALHS